MRNWVKIQREQRKWTQQKLADKSGLSLSQIKHIETQTEETTKENLEKIASALKTSIINISLRECMKNAKETAEALKRYPEYNENQIFKWKMKMIKDLSTNNTDKVIENLLEISNVFQEPFDFIFVCIEDMQNNFESTRPVIYTFISAL